MRVFVGQDLASIRDYRAAFAAYGSPQGVMSYASLANVTEGLSTPVDYGSGVEFASGALAAVSNGGAEEAQGRRNSEEEEAALQLGLYVAWSLEAIVAGALDAKIDALGEYLASLAPREAFVRIGYEFDNPGNRHAPDLYREAFRRVASNLKTAAPNAKTVWHSWCFEPWDAAGDAGVAAWWPGAALVDYCGVSLFQNAFPDSPLGNLSRARDLVAFCKDRGRPTIVAESTPFGLGDDEPASTIWDRWFAPVLDFVQDSDVEIWSYINADWDAQRMWAGQGWGDTRIQRYPALRDKWIADVLRADAPGTGRPDATRRPSKRTTTTLDTSPLRLAPDGGPLLHLLVRDLPTSVTLVAACAAALAVVAWRRAVPRERRREKGLRRGDRAASRS